MTSIPLAMTWDIWLRGRRQLVYSIVCAVATLVILYRAAMHNQWWTDELSATLFNVFFRIEAIWFIAGACAAIGPARRLYAWPISSAAIAAWQLLPAMAVVALAYICVTVGFNAMTDEDWPILAPTLFLATAVAAMQTTIWATAGLDLLRVLAGVAVGFALHQWFTARHYHESDLLAVAWRTILPGEAAFLTAVIAASFAVSIWSISRDRCGELPWRRLPSLQDLWLKIGCYAGRVRPFRSPRSAQFWSEWREKGYIGPVVFAGYFVCVLVWYLLGWSDERRLVLATFEAGYWLVPLFAIMGLSFGKCGGTVRNPACGSFFATRPMTDKQLAYSMLKGAAASILATAFCWICAIVGVIVLLFARFQEGRIDSFPALFGLQSIVAQAAPWGWLLVPTLVAVAMWTVIGFVAPLVMTGRGWLLALAYGGSLFVMIIYVLVVDWLEKLRVAEPVYWINFTLLGLAVLLVAAAFVAAWRMRLIGRRELSIACSLWLAVLLLCLLPLHVGTAIRGGVEYIFLLYYADIFVPFIAVLPLFPLAAAPLAIHWNRHR